MSSSSQAVDGVWDAIVVGSGASGGVAAMTLAEGGARVLLIDAGPNLSSGEALTTEPGNLMRRSHGQVLSKGGAEGIQCLSRIGEGLGVAIKVEDGSRRAKQAVALYLLRELEWLTPVRLQELEDEMLEISPGVKLEVSGALQFRNS